MKRKLNIRLIKKVLYSLSLLAISVWLIIWLASYWGANTHSTSSANNATVVQINNGLQSLNKPNVIVPGQTSGNANALISNYLSAQKAIGDKYLESANVFLHGHHTFKISSINKRAYKEFNAITVNIYNTTNILTAVQKFLEYNPIIDLAPVINGEEQGDNERLQRTKAGITDVINSVKASEYTKAGDIEALLSPLLDKVDTINASNAETWYKDVENAQKQIIFMINQDFEQYINESYNTLTEIAQDYLD